MAKFVQVIIHFKLPSNLHLPGYVTMMLVTFLVDFVLEDMA